MLTYSKLGGIQRIRMPLLMKKPLMYSTMKIGTVSWPTVSWAS